MLLLSSISNKDLLFVFSANKVAAEEVPLWVPLEQKVVSGPKNTFHIQHHITCSSVCVIYSITCTKCSILYIGETCRQLSTTVCLLEFGRFSSQ